MEEVISITNLRKTFKRKTIFDEATIKINKKDIVGLIGPSGQGKSVFIKTIIKFLKPNSGEIKIDSKEIGFSMQANSIYETLTVIQNLNYFGKLYGVSRKERKERSALLLKELGLEQYEKTLVNKLSGGTKKRVDIACALINDPEILVLDEPFLGLDPELIESLSRFFLYLNEKGKTILISSHRISEISLICTRFILMKNKTISEIKKEKIREAYK